MEVIIYRKRIITLKFVLMVNLLFYWFCYGTLPAVAIFLTDFITVLLPFPWFSLKCASSIKFYDVFEQPIDSNSRTISFELTISCAHDRHDFNWICGNELTNKYNLKWKNSLITIKIKANNRIIVICFRYISYQRTIPIKSIKIEECRIQNMVVALRGGY